MTARPKVPAEISSEATEGGEGTSDHGELFTGYNLPPIEAPEDMPLPPDEVAARKAAEGSDEGNTGEPSGDDPLKRELEALKAEREDERRRYQEMLDQQQQSINQLMQGIAPQQQAGGMTQSQQQNFAAENDLPDPVERPKDFARAVADLVRNSTQQATSNIQQQTTQQQQLAAMRDRFWNTNSDLSGVPELVEAAYQKEAQRLQAQGVDPQQAALSDPDGISSRVAQAARERASQLGLQLGQGQGAQQAPSSGHNGRTAGVSAGSSQGPSKAPKKAPDPGMMEELKSFQRETGFF